MQPTHRGISIQRFCVVDGSVRDFSSFARGILRRMSSRNARRKVARIILRELMKRSFYEARGNICTGNTAYFPASFQGKVRYARCTRSGMRYPRRCNLAIAH
jgi:hypothetical protein